jgi:hypothetical protein
MQAVQQFTIWSARRQGLTTLLRTVMLCGTALLLVWPLCICATHTPEGAATAMSVASPLSIAGLPADKPSGNSPLAPLVHCALHCPSQVIAGSLPIAVSLALTLGQRLLCGTTRPLPCVGAPPLLPPPQRV